jgi:extradiol dioxygenase family protein
MRELPSSAAYNIHLSDRENAGLRGPVRTSIEETTTGKDVKYLVTTDCTLQGRRLMRRTNGPDPSKMSITTWTYDNDGRLIKITSGRSGQPPWISTRTYDERGRLKTIVNGPAQDDRVDVYYDEEGRKTSVKRFDSKIPIQQIFLSGHSVWDSAAMGAGVPKGGNVTTLYDEDDQTTELQVRSAEGDIISRVVRTYDVNGRVTEEKLILENPGHQLSEELRTQLGPQQIKRVSEMVGAFLVGKRHVGAIYTYDAQNRLTQICERNPGLEKTTTIIYNDQGDKVEERTNCTDNSAFPVGIPYALAEDGTLVPSDPTAKPTPLPLRPEEYVRYAYQYDSFGNWIQQTMTVRSDPDRPPTELHRTLSYYD